MSRTHAQSSRVLLNSSHVSGDITGYRLSHRRILSEVTSLLSDGEQFLPGQIGGALGLDGLFNSGAGNLTDVIDLAAPNAAGLLATVLPDGLTVGAIAFLAQAHVASRAVDGAVKDAVKMTIEGTPEDGVDFGVLLHALTAETADGNASSIDNAASSTGGGLANLHVTAFSGLTSISIRVQHSADNSSWSDLVTFTSVTATTWERKTVTGTVNRYIRAWWDVTGTGSCTFALAFARR